MGSGTAANGDGDPGWRLKGLLPLLTPVILPFRARGRFGDRDLLYALRSSFISFVSSIVLFGFFLTFMSGIPEHGVLSGLVIVLAWALASVVISLVTDRGLDCVSEEALVHSYRRRFFLRSAFGESIALLAFVLTFA
ncbi:MAG TPA: hypothetical protein VGI86_17155, partial [Acidimicrobiia bacterium]